jgi:hypothetical protein
MQLPVCYPCRTSANYTPMKVFFRFSKLAETSSRLSWRGLERRTLATWSHDAWQCCDLPLTRRCWIKCHFKMLVSSFLCHSKELHCFSEWQFYTNSISSTVWLSSSPFQFGLWTYISCGSKCSLELLATTMVGHIMSLSVWRFRRCHCL